MRPTTLVDVLQSRALERGQKMAFTYLSDDEAGERSITFAELDRMARGVAAQLQDAGAGGTRVLLLYPPGLEFITAFLGCLYAGSVAVPSYPPNPSRAERSSAVRLATIVQDARPAFALTTGALETRVRTLCDEMGVDGGVNCLVPSLEATMDAEAWSVPDIPADSIAFLQYTSGSTGRPKGVLVSHGNVMHNLRSISAAIRITDDDIGVNWLPPYHDMGLVGGLLQPVYEGTSVVLMSPVSFLHRPLRWLSTISRVRATVSGGPDFAYDLGAKRITPEQKEGLDLSCWRAALNGAEPIRPATLQAFQEAFAPCGFSPKAWAPCYGLAEATLFVAGGRCDGDVLSHRFDGESLERGLGIVVQESGGVRRREIAASGRPADGLLVEIVHPTEHTPCPPGTVGEIWVQGPSVAQGYWDKIDLSDAAFHACTAGDGKGPFLRTGDLGFLEAGSLFVTGRLQDVITFGSRTLYPQDIENTAHESHPALRRGASAAFGIEAGGETGVVVLCEVERQSMRGLDGGTVVATIRQRVQEEHQVTLSAVLLLRMGAIPRTSSGKIQRRACRDLYSSDRLDALMVGEGERSPTTEASDSG